MIVHHGRFARIGEVWFDEEPSPKKVDMIRYVQRPQPVAGARCEPFHTSLIDLSLEAETLLKRMRQDTRYEIRRAGEKDGITYACWHAESGDYLERFCDFYDDFAGQKGLPTLDRGYVAQLASAARLTLSRVENPAGQELVWHAYYRGAERVRLLYSCSQFRASEESSWRNLVGRANRYHHWRDMLQFQQEGVSLYDLGGWYAGDADTERLKINQFKAEFGGEIVCNFTCEQTVSARGHVVRALRDLLQRK